MVEGDVAQAVRKSEAILDGPRAPRSVLSYWSNHFDPNGRPSRPDYSTGWIAKRLHGILAERGPVDYWDYAERYSGVDADVFVGHFWAFAELCRSNDFERKTAIYVLSDPLRATALLREAADHYGVPFPDWDLPPAQFDHEETMERADAVVLVGNSATLDSFDARWHPKIELVNYATEPWPSAVHVERRRDFIYAATTCGLRKGFLDVIDTWREIRADTRLHVVGQIEEPYIGRLAAARAQSVHTHGWIPSTSRRYRQLLQSCRYAYIPTWVEGQMGTVLDVIAAGCVPLTTRASGVDDRVLEHCVVIEPRHPQQHREAIAMVLAWSDTEFRERQSALADAVARLHTWSGFDDRIKKVVWNDN